MYSSPSHSPTTRDPLMVSWSSTGLHCCDVSLCTLFSFAVDASAAMQVRALKDYCNNYDLTSLNIKAGDIITVRRSDNWTTCCILLNSVFIDLVYCEHR